MAKADRPGMVRVRRARWLPLMAIWLAAVVCLGAVLVLAAQPASAAANIGNAPSAPFIPQDDTPTATAPTPTTVPPTPTSPVPTATPPGHGKPTETPTAAATTPTPTPTTAPTTGDGGGNNGGGTNGGSDPNQPQPTKVVLAQPTAGTSSGPLQGAGFNDGANGVWVATGFGCLTALLGILVAVGAMSVLVRGGYGPFLRALVLGARASAKGKGGSVDSKTGSAPAVRPQLADDDEEWARPSARAPRAGRASSADWNAAPNADFGAPRRGGMPSQSRAPSRAPSRGASLPAPAPTPRQSHTRSRPDW